MHVQFLALCSLDKFQNKFKLAQLIHFLKTLKMHAIQSLHLGKRKAQKKSLKASHYLDIHDHDERMQTLDHNFMCLSLTDLVV